ncbi:YfiR family protein [Thalassotalea ganghwensis]
MTKEDKLTVAFIYQITKFALWPTSEKTQQEELPIALCAVGNISKEMKSGFEEIINKYSQKRPLTFSQISDVNNLVIEKPSNCDLLYFPANSWQSLSQQQLTALSKASLTIGKDKQFLKSGGLLSLILIDNKMKIFLSHKVLANSDIKLQSRFIALTKSVDD